MKTGHRTKLIMGGLLVILLTGCAAPATPSRSATPAATSPSPGLTSTPQTTQSGPSGSLAVGESSFEYENFDPIGNNGWNILAPLGDWLVMTDASEKVSTGIAERWELAPDGLSWIFYIRKGLKFHNGDDLTAKDVKFSLDRFTLKEALYSYIRDMQDRVEAVDNYTVRVYTKGTQPFYWRQVSNVPGHQGQIMPKDYFEKVGIDYFKQHPVGSGPFKFVRWVQGDMVQYEAMDKHYPQAAAFKNLSIINMPETATRVAALRTGQLDLIEIAPEQVPDIEGAGLRTISLVDSQTTFVIFGAYDPRAKSLPVSDVRVRQALSLAINRDEIGRSIFHGKFQQPLTPYLSPNQPGIDLPYWKSETAKAYRYDPEEAKRLLAAAGHPNGFAIKSYSFTLAGAGYLPRLAEVVQSYWLRVGIRSEIVPVDWSFIASRRRSGPNRGPADEVVGQTFMNKGVANLIAPARALSTGFGSSSPFDLTQGGIPDVDALIANGMNQVDDAKRADTNAKLLRLTTDAYVWNPIGSVPGLVGVGPRVDIDSDPRATAIGAVVRSAKHKK